MTSWSEFYAVIGAAAATLTGLLFVAASMNAVVALSAGATGSRRLTEQAFQNYLAVLMVSLLALFPDIKLRSFGKGALLLTAGWAFWVLVRLYQAAAERTVHETRLVAVWRHRSTLIGFGLLVYSAARMAFSGADMRNTVAAANMVILFSATEKAWALLNRIAAFREQDRHL